MKAFRTIASAALAVCLTASLACPAFAARYTDTQTHWACETIEQASDLGLFNGTDGKFNPNEKMSRAMFVTVLQRVAQNAGLNAAPANACTFPDVPSGAYYAASVAWANENGIVEGSDGIFQPNAPVTREQMCLILQRYFKWSGAELTEGSGEAVAFLDGNKIHTWAKTAVDQISSLKIVQGSPVSGGVAFRPLDSVTRAEAATVFVRLHTVLEGENPETPAQPEGGNGGAGGAGGSGSPDNGESNVDPEEAAKIAGYLSNMIDSFTSGSGRKYYNKADAEVKACMDTLMDCLQRALDYHNSGRLLSREYVLATFENEIQIVRDAYKSFDDERLGQLNNIVVRLETTDHIYAVMDFFGVSY